MKSNRLLWLLLLFFSTALQAQTDYSLLLRQGRWTPEPNIRPSYIDSLNAALPLSGSRQMMVVQFHLLPTEETRKRLSESGITLLEYLPNLAYLATISAPLRAENLTKEGVRSLFSLRAEQKMDDLLSNGKLPSWAVRIAGTVDLWISFPSTFRAPEVLDSLRRKGFDILSQDFLAYGVLALRINPSRLRELASLPYISFVQAAPAPDQVLNHTSRTVSRANALNASVANGGRGLSGEGVVVGVGDNADIQTHADFSGRLINRAPLRASGHGHHVAGTVAGGGIINELFRGYAPKATVIKHAFSNILINAPTYVQDHGMVITNNSYGDIIECSYHGTYDLTSRILDQMAFELPNLTNVFAAGNSGTTTCFPYGQGYRTIIGGYQTAKNVVTVGATTDSGMVASFSSKGPVRDGRTKPEIAAMGQLTVSTWPTNLYSFNSGTSMASPAVAGGAALLYQRYRQLHGGANPKNGLMKALLCNGAQERGSTGPDYSYGFGWMNLLRSVEMLEAGRYFTAASVQGGTNQHTITVPPNTAQLKVLLYWNDPAASLISSRALVNDLDLQVVNAAGTVSLPFILDTTAGGLGTGATTGIDRINNLEQVVISNPPAGTYTLRVNGSSIAQHPQQEYFLVYDLITTGLQLTIPAGGEGLVAGEHTRINWESAGLTGTVNLEFSSDNGATWTPIASGVDINRPTFSWWVPTVSTSTARIRVSQPSGGASSVSQPFTIIGQPVASLAPDQCEGYIALNWTAVAGATDYEVMQLKNGEMQRVAITTANSYTFSGLSKDSTYWVTVRARINGKEGRRAGAVSRQPATGSCAGSISDHDLSLEAVMAPRSGRRFTSTQLSASTPVTVRIKNLDNAPSGSFQAGYSINGGAWQVETVTTPVGGGTVYQHTFSTTADLSTTGIYTVRAFVRHTNPDGVTANDTATTIVKHIDNQPLNLATAFTDQLEGAAAEEYRRDTIGLAGIERYDLSSSTSLGRARTFVNTGIAYSGSRALTLDASRVIDAGNTNYLYGTFNLSNYHALGNDLRLDFRFLSHSNEAHANNRVWIRGRDTDPWIELYDLSANGADPGIYRKTESLELSDALAAASQGFGTSFQVRWGQFGKWQATDRLYAAGYTIDDIRVYEVFNDIQMRAVQSPALVSCGLGSSTPLQVAVRNSANTTLTNIPVRYRINNGPWVSEVIPSLAANATLSYTFSTRANLGALGTYAVQFLADLPSDSYRDNDTLNVQIRNLPLITSFPYLQNFEGAESWWFAEGKNSTWQLGTPASGKIRRAASGSKAWKTRLQGNYNDNEQSYLYSPCFDISGMTAPTLSFSAALDIEDCGNTLCDGAWVEYSTDGVSWTKLGTAGTGTNWYNKSGDRLWSIQDYTAWHVATAALPAGLNRIQLRFVFSSDGGVSREGIAIDDIHLYDNTKGIYDGATLTAPVTAVVNGNSWVEFTSGGKLVAALQPSGQNLGSTQVQAFIFDGPVRTFNQQYYPHRNLTIKPQNTGLDSVTVRFYFLDKEIDTLLKSTSCAGCSKPGSAYEVGVSKYSDPDRSFENGSLLDNQQGIWQYLGSDSVIKVPFDKGYYAEFRVKDFSEFWLNNGGVNRATPLPVKMLEFTAQRSGASDVVTRWKVAAEDNVVRYEVELARGDNALQNGVFEKIGDVAGQGNSTTARQYSFTDSEPDKLGRRYYRLKTINLDGSFVYSPVRMVQFGEAELWTVYPNPSAGVFHLIWQGAAGEVLDAKVLDANGRLVKVLKATGSGGAQKLIINLSAEVFASGVYLLQTTVRGEQQVFRLNKL